MNIIFNKYNTFYFWLVRLFTLRITEWGCKEYRITVSALFMCDEIPSDTIDLLKPLKITKKFVYRTFFGPIQRVQYYRRQAKMWKSM